MPKIKKQDNLQTRPPIVVILGHVDHGKTSILDYIRKAHVVKNESGGITQHIGAYEAEYKGKKITFIDTPGHEAFSAMRSRGANVADIAVLVVAAEEGPKPQTKEAITFIKKAGIPFIVALNKIDKPEANPEKVKLALAQSDILVESIGGKVPSIETSGITGKGIAELLELILLMAEMEELKGDQARTGEGVVIESFLDSKRGPTATLLLRDGILKQGDIIATSSVFGKVRILEDFQGAQIKKVFPSQPCIVLGLENVPGVGEIFKIYSDIKSAKAMISKKTERKITFIDKGIKVLNVILKVDVLGSKEAVEKVLDVLPQEKVNLRIIKAGVGDISETDIKLASAGKAKILGFRVKADRAITELAETKKIDILLFDIIYELCQGARQAMEKILEPETIREDVGKLKVLLIFRTEKNRQIIGGRIVNGIVRKGLSVEVLQGEEKISKGKMISLQKNKKDIGKAVEGDEVAILYEGKATVKEGDTLIFYSQKTEKGEL